MKPLYFAVSLAAVLSGEGARAATFTVTSLGDQVVADAQLTLREAILAANATPDPDEIVFATGPGTILLTGPLPPIVSPLAITGPGANLLTIEGGSDDGMFSIATDTTVTISRLAIRNGRSSGDGAAILNDGTLTVVDCVLSGNAGMGEGGAIWNGGSLTLRGSLFSANSALNGGAVFNQGALEVSGSLFQGNFTGGIAPFVGGGGAILNIGQASIADSAFSTNAANSGAGLLGHGTLTVTNSTFTGNNALRDGGGMFLTAAVSATVTACTVTGNRADSDNDGLGTGGGIALGTGSLLLRASLVAENLWRSSTRQDVVAAVQPASADNVIGVGLGLTGISDGTNGNQIGTAASPLDPRLGPLQDNGGPTPTRAVLPGSPALDRGSAGTCPPLDQRGITRPLDGDNSGVAACDVGAFEAFTVATAGASFYTLAPCRVADTRQPAGASGGPALGANRSRFFPVAGLCGIPADAKAVAFNVTVVNQTDAGNLRLYPAGSATPTASTLNFAVGVPRANNALLPLGADGAIAVRCDMPPGSTGTVNLVLDVYGYLK